MALPDYSQYPKYADYRSGYTGAKNDMLSRRQFRQGRKGWQPPVTSTTPAVSPIASQTVQPVGDPNRDYSAHPFFDPNASYSTRPGSQQAVPPGSTAYNYYASEESPEGYYYGILNEQGFGGIDARSLAAQGMFRDYARGYQAAKLRNHDLWFPEYMGMQDIGANIRNMSNNQLGIDENLYGGRDRWSLRGY